jgi:hypothetical protein
MDTTARNSNWVDPKGLYEQQWRSIKCHFADDALSTYARLRPLHGQASASLLEPHRIPIPDGGENLDYET